MKFLRILSITILSLFAFLYALFAIVYGTFFPIKFYNPELDRFQAALEQIPLPEKTKKAPSKKPVAKPKQTQQHKKRFDDRSKKPRPQQVESSQRTFNNGDHHHDPVTGTGFTKR